MDLRKTRNLYAEMKVFTVNPVDPKKVVLSTLYIPVTVSASLYCNNLIIDACNLLREDQIANKRAILPWQLSIGKILKKVILKLENKDKQTRRVTVTINPTGVATSVTCSKILALKELVLDGQKWTILKTTLNEGKMVLDQID